MILGIYSSSGFINDKLSNKTVPLGLLTLLSNCQHKSIIFNEMVSGDILEYSNILFNSQIIFFTLSVANVQRTTDLSKKLKAMGKKIFWGGPEVTMNGPVLLRDHPYVDGIVVGTGEQVLESLLNEDDNTNRVFLQKNITRYSRFIDNYEPINSNLNFSQISIDYDLLYDLNKYEGLSYLWGNDCSQWKKRCYFCGRTSMGIGYRNSTDIWNELLPQYRNGFRFFYNTTDSVTTNINLFTEFCDAKPKEIIEAYHRIFVNANQVNEKLINSLKKINGIPVIGIESFSNLDNSGKVGISNTINLQAMDKLSKAGLKFVISFVFGLPSETIESIEYNSSMIRKIVQYYGLYIDSIHISPLLITTGSKAYHDLFKLPEIKNKYSDKINPFNAISLSEDYFINFCQISRKETIQEIYKLTSDIKSIAPHIMIGAKGITQKEFNEIKIEELLPKCSEELQIAT